MGSFPIFRTSFFALLAALVLMPRAEAGLIVENSFFYDISGVTSGSSDAYSKIFDSFFAGSTFGKGYFIGWNVNYVTRSNAIDGVTTSLAGYEMGPKVGMYVNKAQTLSLAVALNPLVKASATTADGSTASWSGFGFQGEVAYAPQIGKYTWIGIKLILDDASFSSATSSANTTSSISYSSTTIIPTIYVSWRFN